MQSNDKNQRGLRKRRQRGADLIEFTMVLIPLLAIMFVLIDISWGIFVKATLQYAVRAGLRYGITITATQAKAASNSDLTTMVKDYVQANSLGTLTGTANRAYIQVNFFKLDSSTPPNVVSANGDGDGNVSPNIMQVSVVNFPLRALAPRIFSLAIKPDNSASTINAASADQVEPSNDVPPMGAVP